jgi:hypothetical protein
VLGYGAAPQLPWSAQEAIRHTEYDRLRGSSGRGPGLMGAWPEAAVTFVENHDTGKGVWVLASQVALAGLLTASYTGPNQYSCRLAVPASMPELGSKHLGSC